MSRNPYIRFRGKELGLADYLAIDRTVLANERSLLAYGRTALAMLAIGGSCIKFFDARWIQMIGVVFIVASVVVAAFGWTRFRRMRHYLSAALQEQTGAAEHPLEETVHRRDEEQDESPRGSQRD
jgi:putative membrane protein